jgi:hypothetical protein
MADNRAHKAQPAKPKKKKKRVSRRARRLFYLNTAGFIASVAGLLYHHLAMTYYYGFANVSWLDFLWLTGIYALFVTWHYRIVFQRVYRAIDGVYTHFFVFAGVMGFIWHEYLMFPDASANALQDRLIVMVVWLVVLMGHAYYVRQQKQSGARATSVSATRQTTQPDISRLQDTVSSDDNDMASGRLQRSQRQS